MALSRCPKTIQNARAVEEAKRLSTIGGRPSSTGPCSSFAESSWIRPLSDSSGRGDEGLYWTAASGFYRWSACNVLAIYNLSWSPCLMFGGICHDCLHIAIEQAH